MTLYHEGSRELQDRFDSWRIADRLEARVVDVVHGLREQHGDVVVVQLVDREPSISDAPDEPEMAQQAKLVRAERLLEPDARGKGTDRTRTVAQARKQAHAARGRERLHRLGHRLGRRGVDIGERDPVAAAVGHRRLTIRMNICSC